MWILVCLLFFWVFSPSLHARRRKRYCTDIQHTQTRHTKKAIPQKSFMHLPLFDFAMVRSTTARCFSTLFSAHWNLCVYTIMLPIFFSTSDTFQCFSLPTFIYMFEIQSKNRSFQDNSEKYFTISLAKILNELINACLLACFFEKKIFCLRLFSNVEKKTKHFGSGSKDMHCSFCPFTLLPIHTIRCGVFLFKNHIKVIHSAFVCLSKQKNSVPHLLICCIRMCSKENKMQTKNKRINYDFSDFDRSVEQ